MREKDTYEEPKILTFPNAVIKVFSPILTKEEKKRRMERIAKSAEELLKSKTTEK